MSVSRAMEHDGEQDHDVICTRGVDCIVGRVDGGWRGGVGQPRQDREAVEMIRMVYFALGNCNSCVS